MNLKRNRNVFIGLAVLGSSILGLSSCGDGGSGDDSVDTGDNKIAEVGALTYVMYQMQ